LSSSIALHHRSGNRSASRQTDASLLLRQQLSLLSDQPPSPILSTWPSRSVINNPRPIVRHRAANQITPELLTHRHSAPT
jgi:hypothetical protein